MMNHHRIVCLAAALAAVFAVSLPGCGETGDSTFREAEVDYARAGGRAAGAAHSDAGLFPVRTGILQEIGSSGASDVLAAPMEPEDAQRQIIRNGSIHVEVEDAREAVAELESLSQDFGGYVGNQSISERQYGGDVTRLYAEVTLRVPASLLDSALSVIRTFGEVKSEGISTEDVTEE